MTRKPKSVLVVDVGGTQVKILATGHAEARCEASGRRMDAQRMVDTVCKLADSWDYKAVSLGYPGRVLDGKPIVEPKNLKHGWVEFDYEAAFGCPVKIMNDAAMQALGSYQGGRMLFLGLGTGLGSVLIIDGKIVPLSLGDLPFRPGGGLGHYLSRDGQHRLGHRRWEKAMHEAVEFLLKAFEADYIVLGGGQAAMIEHLPPHTKRGDNMNAFEGGFLMWP
jgi:polyphosphate glucokinase